jgi:hypothetical protein
MSKQETDGSTILISLDPDHKRNITINYQDLRPQTPGQRSKTVWGMLHDEVDCFELSFEDQNKDPKPYHEIFFDDDELDTIFDHARLAVEVSRDDNHPIDPRSGRLVRYSHDEAVRLGIVPGIAVVSMD